MTQSSCAIDGSCCGPDSDCCIQGAEFRAATHADFAEVAELLGSLKLPVAGVDKNIHGFIVAEKKGRIIGTAAIEQYETYGLLRSVAVAEALKGQGLGTSLVHQAIDRAHRESLEGLFLLTTTAEEYFPRFGFTRISRSDVPEALLESEELRGACPDSAIVMRLKL